MESISNTIERKIAGHKSGSVILPADFRGEGAATAINMALSRLATKGKLRRLAHGIYYKPQIHPVFGEQIPAPERVAETIARKDRVHIRPSGMYALHRLGLTTQVPTKLVYLTDGQRRKINVGKAQISFKPTTARKMALKGPLSGLVIQALEELGTDNLKDEIKEKLKGFLLKEKPDLLKKDLALAPAHIYNFILKLLKDGYNDRMVRPYR